MSANDILSSDKIGVELMNHDNFETSSAASALSTAKKVSVFAVAAIISVITYTAAQSSDETLVNLTVVDLPPFDIGKQLSDQDLIELASSDAQLRLR